MAEFAIDVSRLPLVVIDYPDEFTIDDYRAVFLRYRALSLAHPRIAWLVDFRGFNPLLASPELRKAAAVCFAESKDVLMKVSVCEARVVDSVAARGVLIGFDWLTGTKWPTKNFGRFEAAERWCLEELAR